MQQRNSTKERVRSTLKILIGGLLVYYVIQANMIDFQSLSEVVFKPLNLIIAIGFLGFSAFCISARWYFLVRAQGINLAYRDVFALTMIGNFFNTFMPGAVGGDLIKAWYIAGKVPNRKTKAIFTVLIDRAIGLSVIVCYASVTLLIYSKWMRDKPELQAIGLAIWSFSLFAFIFAVLFFWPRVYKTLLVKRTIESLTRFKPLRKVIEAALLYRQHLPTILITLVWSAASITATVFLWTVQGAQLNLELTLSQYFFIVPLGLTVSAVPLLPGGIGVGQLAFFTLFQWMGFPNPEQGGTLCTLMQVYIILFNFLGAIFYVRYKKLPQPATTPQEAQDPSSFAAYHPATTETSPVT